MRLMKVSGIGRVVFWGGGNLWIGLAVDAIDPHAHHAIQVAVGFSGPVEFRSGGKAEWTAYPGGALVRPGTPHAFRAPGQRVANILFEPETALGRALLERFAGDAIVPLHTHARDLAAAFDDGADDDDLGDTAMALLARLAGTERPQRPTDPRILKAIDYIARHVDEPLSLGDVAAVAGLSDGRFRHLFVAETGIAFRPYVLWTRLNRALEMGFGGTSWTEAAYATGFADSAHLTRTCRRMYGLFPSSLRIDRTVQDSRQIA
ncbi:AraC family transcriptional regulator [Devosia sp.]|uniref:helix-turn-helix domain-containing protein n=1 Tax=Devosia sp. TaxID=1871048 RepID=UPI001ACFB382|nr:AraC family transcriptional regulator [Devosia sp.]MBN9309866.1 helix-turn-helix domain-containing protein [Devosia sp.]